MAEVHLHKVMYEERMVLELATILLGAGLGAALVLYAAPRGYFGHSRKRVNSEATEYSTSEVSNGQVSESTNEIITQQTNPQPLPSNPVQGEVRVVRESDSPSISDTQVPPVEGGNIKNSRVVRRRAASNRSTSRRRARQQ